MDTRNAYKQKIEAELELVKAQVEVLKAKAKGLSADANLECVKEINEMEDSYAMVKSKLQELGEASESTWENLKVETENLWNSLSTNVKSAIDKLKQ